MYLQFGAEHKDLSGFRRMWSGSRFHIAAIRLRAHMIENLTGLDEHVLLR